MTVGSVRGDSGECEGDSGEGVIVMTSSSSPHQRLNLVVL